MKTITDIDGVYASGMHCGVKSNGELDLSYLYLPACYGVAGVFTKNSFAAPCIPYTKNCLQKSLISAVIINSGNANAATGKLGEENVKRTVKKAAQILKLDPEQIAIASTGIIGKQLPIEKIEKGLEQLLKDPEKKEGGLAAEAILTTDTVSKHCFFEQDIGQSKIQIAGIAKGVGMIAPNMATMLSYLVTNAKLESHYLQEALKMAVDKTFNMISVDSDTSTNDMTMLFSTGEKPLSSDKELEEFENLLEKACHELALQIVSDGEGAKKVIEASVTGAKSLDDARELAKSIINSPLIKTAVHGEDPNWGRIVMAIGKNDKIKIDPKLVNISIQGVCVFKSGEHIQHERDEISKLMQENKVKIDVGLNLSSHSATAWGCDLSKEYIDINTAYN